MVPFINVKKDQNEKRCFSMNFAKFLRNFKIIAKVSSYLFKEQRSIW